MRFFALLFFATVCRITAAEILWDSCEGEADFPEIKEGNYFNLCIKDHEFTDKKWAWNLCKSTVTNTVFDGCFFQNTRERISNFTEVSWNTVVFKDCEFSSFIDDGMIFDDTIFTNVQFIGCTFHSSADIHFTKFSFNNVSFVDCDFQSDTNFSLGEINGMAIDNSRIKRSKSATTASGSDSFRMRDVRVRELSIKDSQFINPVRFEGFAGADIAVNDSSFNQLFCRSLGETIPFQSKPEIKYSEFNDTIFAGVEFFDKVLCDQTTWHGMHFENVTFWTDASFGSSRILDLYWNQVNMSTIDGSQSELDFSKTILKRRVLANTTVNGVANFRDSVFETVLVQNFNGEVPDFEDAEFRQEYVDGTCCTISCKTLKCVCNITEPSGACPEGDHTVNLNIIPICFPASASLRRHDNTIVNMENLAVSERVAIGGGEHSDIYFFGHRSPHVTASFVSIQHEASETPLLISADHYLYVNGKLSTARMVKSGDLLRGANGMDTVTVLTTTSELHRGLYAPTSLHGDLLVDDIVVSSYTKALHPDFAHKMLYPLRLLYRYASVSVLSRFTMLHERSWAGVARFMRLPEGTDVIGV
ncbi:unnamed protein product [Agarophyton chilense]